MTLPVDAAGQRRAVYALLLVVTCAAVCSRIWATNRAYEPYLYPPGEPTDKLPRKWPQTRPEPMPTHSSNDRSRWLTIRALVEQGTYVIGKRVTDSTTGKHRDSGLVTENGWETVDRVLDPEPAARSDNETTQLFYSSKPPFFPSIVAAEYWLLYRLLGWEVTTHRWLVVPIALLTFNVLPLIVYLLLLRNLVERFGTSDWGRFFVMSAACFGTFLTTFQTTLNNHTLATCTALFALYPAIRILLDGERRARYFVLCGFFAAFAACTELPAAALLALLFLLLLLRAPRRTLMFFLPAALPPLAFFFLTNYWALGSWRPAYGEFGGPWYQFDGSHWQPDPHKKKLGIDWASEYESRATYAFHFLIGHHGLFSLSPIWLLSLAGALSASVVALRRLALEDARLTLTRRMTTFLVIVVVGFYLWRSNNYGGWTCGPRWLMWLTPFLLLSLLPVADRLGSNRAGRIFAYACLAVAVFSASYAPLNPWRHPWLYSLMESQGWIPY
jgi:hypothetical protein